MNGTKEASAHGGQSGLNPEATKVGGSTPHASANYSGMEVWWDLNKNLCFRLMTEFGDLTWRMMLPDATSLLRDLEDKLFLLEDAEKGSQSGSNPVGAAASGSIPPSSSK